jgi:TPR repeat protein
VFGFCRWKGPSARDARDMAPVCRGDALLVFRKINGLWDSFLTFCRPFIVSHRKFKILSGRFKWKLKTIRHILGAPLFYFYDELLEKKKFKLLDPVFFADSFLRVADRLWESGCSVLGVQNRNTVQTSPRFHATASKHGAPPPPPPPASPPSSARSRHKSTPCHTAAQATMTKPFAQCSLPDFALEISLAACAVAGSALDAAAAAQLLPRLADAEATEAALQRHPLVRGASGLVCTGAAESRYAWCSMLRDLFSAAGHLQGNVAAAAAFARVDHPDGTVNSICASTKDQSLESLRLIGYQQGKKGFGAPAAALVSDAALLRVYLVCKLCCRRGRVRVCAITSGFSAHPTDLVASHELVAHITAHPLYCLASQINFARWRAMLRCHTPLPAHAPHWHVTSIDVGLQQRQALLCGGALLRVLVPRLLRVQGEYGVIYPLNLARRMASRRHFLGSKLHQAEGVFEEGQRLYGEQRFSEAADRWGRAALLQHAPSHAHLSDMLIEGRPGVAKDEKRGFELANAGAALGCAHSMGVLGRCYVFGYGVAEDEVRGLALGRESAAAGSSFGQFVVGWCYRLGCGGVAKDYAEAVRLYRLAAAQGNAGPQNSLGCMFHHGKGVAQDYAEAARLYSLAAAQGHASAQTNLGLKFANGQGVAQDYAEAVRLYRLAAAQGHAAAQYNLGVMFEKGQGVAQDRAEAIRLYRLTAAQRYKHATAALERLGV